MPRSSHTRSNNGCWTCRARKKKCDERYPRCVGCDSRGLVCHGYALRPDWMDGGQKERDMLEDFKKTVRNRLHAKRAKAPNTGAPPLPVSTALQHPVNGFRPSALPLDSIFSDPTALDINVDVKDWSSFGSLDTNSVVLTDPSIRTAPAPAMDPSHLSAPGEGPASEANVVSPFLDTSGKDGETEAAIVMNYFDCIFRLQFPCYSPPANEFGRGWLLAILMRTKPLYHTALSLSAYHIHLALLDSNQEDCARKCWGKMEDYYALALSELQSQLNSLNLTDTAGKLRRSIEIVACIIQLISFELFKGSTGTWQMHLQAASSIVPFLIKHYQATTTGNLSYAASAQNASKSIVSTKRTSVDEISRDFFLGVFCWYDIISCASTQCKPWLGKAYIDLLGGSTSKIQLHKVMGCENWVLLLIAEVSELYRWKTDKERVGRLSMVELFGRASRIEHRLKNGLSMEQTTPARDLGKISSAASKKVISVITHIFASSCLTYLHVVTFGARPELSEVRDSVSLSIAAFRDLPDPLLFRNAAWPFCVTGCMALEEQQAFFTELVATANAGTNIIGRDWKVLEVLQECWKGGYSHDASSLPWCTAMSRLGYEIPMI